MLPPFGSSLANYEIAFFTLEHKKLTLIFDFLGKVVSDTTFETVFLGFPPSFSLFFFEKLNCAVFLTTQW